MKKEISFVILTLIFVIVSQNVYGYYLGIDESCTTNSIHVVRMYESQEKNKANIQSFTPNGYWKLDSIDLYVVASEVTSSWQSGQPGTNVTLKICESIGSNCIYEVDREPGYFTGLPKYISFPVNYDEYFEPGVTYYLYFLPTHHPSNIYRIIGSMCTNAYSGGTIYNSDTYKGDTPNYFTDIYMDLNVLVNYTADLTSVPTVENITCTSCDPDDTVSPYQDNDTTPTFTFDTDIHSDCRVHKLNVSYAVMGLTRNCAGGNGGFEHTCTLGSIDKLTSPKGKLYVSCVNSNVESLETPFKLEMNITGLSYDAYDMIQLGIDESSIGASASILSDKKVYLKGLSGSSFFGTIDRLLSDDNQRWIINYEATSALGLFNISPTVYSLDLVNTPLLEIDTIVRNFIDETKE